MKKAIFIILVFGFFGCNGSNNETSAVNPFDIYKAFSKCNMSSYLVLTTETKKEATFKKYENGGFFVETIQNLFNYNGQNYSLLKCQTDIENPNLKNANFVKKIDNDFFPVDFQFLNLENDNCDIFRIETYVVYSSQNLQQKVDFFNMYMGLNDIYLIDSILNKKVNFIIFGLFENLENYNLEMTFCNSCN